MDNIKPGYNHLFNRNQYDGKWYCFTRNDTDNYFSDRSNKDAKIASGSTQEEAFKNWTEHYGTK
jgi:hypothetical protein